MLDIESLSLLKDAAELLKREWSVDGPAFENQAPIEAMRPILNDLAARLTDNYPYPHPLYVGQMLKPPHAIARLAYALAMFVNPNNHALDGGRASSALEREAVADLARMVGFKESLGHLCSGGTMANLEALWVASKLAPGQVIVASEQSHYTHSRMCEVLSLPFETVACDQHGRIKVDALAQRLSQGGVGAVVVTLGTTALGVVEPLDQVLALKAQYPQLRVHVDAAYGGYFCLVEGLSETAKRAYAAFSEADSVVIDPHKHGLQPYGCGCVLFKDSSVGRFYKHDSPYTYFTSGDLHLGEITLECSRPGASAVALWATQRLFPLEKQGPLARSLEQGLGAAREFYSRLEADPRFITAAPPDLDIVVWAPTAESPEQASRLADEVFDRAAKMDLHLAKTKTSASLFGIEAWGDAPVTALRACFMKPEHKDWLDQIWQRLSQAIGE